VPIPCYPKAKVLLIMPRGFMATRIAWSELNGLLIISGAFGVFSRDVLAALGGFSAATLGETWR
jgi:poly-beta-1,6-N-acetyl-D-glucosamine synthase